jgi:hypothetical protein
LLKSDAEEGRLPAEVANGITMREFDIGPEAVATFDPIDKSNCDAARWARCRPACGEVIEASFHTL